MKKTISIIIPFYNEKKNIPLILNDVKQKLLNSDKYIFEIILMDNNSNDGSDVIAKKEMDNFKNIKYFRLSRNFGYQSNIKAGLDKCTGDAAVQLDADGEDDPNLIHEFIKEWENGNKIVLGEKITSSENNFKSFFRKLFYKFLNKISDIKLTNNTTGSGIFDRSVIDKIKNIADPYPYFRGLINEIGEEVKTITFNQPSRKAGLTKNNIFTLYDIGILGIVKHSRKPLRFMVLLGFVLSLISFTTGLFYLIYKLIYWDSFSLGLAPIIVGIFLVSSVQIILLGLVGEYIGIILIHQRNMPLVVEKERINFD